MGKENIEVWIALAISFGVFLFHLGNSAQKFHPVDLKLFDMVGWYFGVAVKGSFFGFENVLEVSVVVNTRHSWDSDFSLSLWNSDGPSLTEVVNIFGDPASKVEIPHVVDGFMISSDENGQDRRVDLGLKVFVEASHGLVLGRAVEVVEVGLVSEGLEIATDDQKIDFDVELFLEFSDLCVHFVKFSVKTPFNDHLKSFKILHSLCQFFIYNSLLITVQTSNDDLNF